MTLDKQPKFAVARVEGNKVTLVRNPIDAAATSLRGSFAEAQADMDWYTARFPESTYQIVVVFPIPEDVIPDTVEVATTSGIVDVSFESLLT